MYKFLRKVPLFKDLPDADLERLCEMVDEVDLQPGEILFEEGTTGTRAFVIQTGALEIIKTSGGREVLVAVRGEGDVIGEMGLIEDQPRSATVRAQIKTQLLAIGKAEFTQLIEVSPSAARALLNTVLTRWRVMEAMLRQGEKMAQLGTLTAGVAHELNNPAAAVRRGADQLREAMAKHEMAQAQLQSLGLDHLQRSLLQEITGETQAGAIHPPEMDAMARSDKEYELEDWLEARGVANAWELAPTLVDLDLETDDLEGLAEKFSAEAMTAAISWLGATYEVYSLLNEVGQGAERISEIVKALKSYSYLDQAPVQSVDIHEGIDNTLLILRNKLKQGVSLRREYAETLPNIQGYGSELNQVWTNIIDNAIDVVVEQQEPPPEIVIKTLWEGDWIRVSISDNGPGVPPEIVHKIFDPFFTTKPPGKGTGLGLNISYNIVVQKHRGDLKVASWPGKTEFTIQLPVGFETGQNEHTPALSTFDILPQAEIEQILKDTKTVAVVGISTNNEKPACTVPKYLQQHGYRIIPVNPNLKEVLGETCYPDLTSIPEPLDCVQIFRRSDAVPKIVDEIMARGANTIWMQEGVYHLQAAEVARASGIAVVMDMCMRVAHKRYLKSQSST
jgi:predicted CoA-binding protein/signal transduction histidine kinase